MRKASSLSPRQRIEFASRALPADTFSVIDFKGDEAISRLYRFEINLVCERADIDLDDVLANVAMLKLVDDEGETYFHGVVAEFEQLHQKVGDTYYRAVLVPRLWQLSLYRVTEVYVDKTTPEVIEAILKESGLTSLDYELSLTGKHTPWTHLCQYQETHFDFISRLMERNGIYFYFAQDAEREKVVITDSRSRHEALPGGRKYDYAAISGLRPSQDKPQVLSLVCRQKQLPQKVVLMDYNYRKPSLELKSEATVDSRGRGEIVLYGEHADDQAEIKELAGIRAEELTCRKRVFHGESNIAAMRPGYLASLDKHFRADFNQNYLVLEVQHEGSQIGMVLQDAGAVDAAGAQAPFYRNSFAAIPATAQFRPERNTTKPRIHGTMNAVIDAEGSGADAEVDEYGRYKVRLQFDRAEHGDAKASQWVRMATPYAGADHGMHFPLRKGTEVLLTFIDGDPNRPIIASAVPNMDTPSVVNRDNARNSVVRVIGGLESFIGGARSQFASIGARANGDVDTFGANTWETEYGWDADAASSLADDAHKTVVYDNAITHNKADTISRTKGDATEEVRGNAKSTTYGNSTEETHGNSDSKTIGNSTEETHGNSDSKTFGNSTEETRGNSTSTTFGDSTSKTIGKTHETYMGATDSMYFGNTSELHLGAQQSLSLDAVTEMFLGPKLEIDLAAGVAIALGAVTELDLLEKMKLKTNETEVALNELKTKLSTTEASVSTLASEVSSVKSTANSVKSKVNDIATRANHIQSNVNKIVSSPVMIDSGAVHIQGKGITLLS
jgi:type VI secretion system secreted protein VgrG